MSVAGGFEKAIERGLKVGCQTVQIFTKSNNQWEAPPITGDRAKTFIRAMKESGIAPVFSHSAYLINVGSPDKSTYEKSKTALKVELERAETLGLAFLVLHPGSHKETGEEPCIARIADTAAWALDQTQGAGVKLLYEIAAGQGACVGHRFEQLAALLKQTGRSGRTGICLDTCHLFAAGYDIRTQAAYEQTMAEFDRVIGLNQVQAVHLNDSKKTLGCRVDRHEHIGKGEIGLEGFRCLLNDKRLNHLPMVLETPKDENRRATNKEHAGGDGRETVSAPDLYDVMNLKVLRGLVKK